MLHIAIVYISMDGENLIKQAFSNSSCRQLDDNNPSTVYTHIDGDVYNVLKTTIDTLQEQLNVKDKQIVELTETIKTQAQSINAYQQKELAGKIIEGKQLIDNASSSENQKSQIKRNTIFSKIFGNRN